MHIHIRACASTPTPRPSVHATPRLTAQALALLRGVDARLTPQAKATWRWRMLLLRAEVDAITVRAGQGFAETLRAPRTYMHTCTLRVRTPTRTRAHAVLCCALPLRSPQKGARPPRAS